MSQIILKIKEMTQKQPFKIPCIVAWNWIVANMDKVEKKQRKKRIKMKMQIQHCTLNSLTIMLKGVSWVRFSDPFFCFSFFLYHTTLLSLFIVEFHPSLPAKIKYKNKNLNWIMLFMKKKNIFFHFHIFLKSVLQRVFLFLRVNID